MDPSLSKDEERWLQQVNQAENQHNMLLTLYFCLLICCCVTPIVYYLRLYLWQRMRLRQLREVEHAGLMSIIQQTMILNERQEGRDGDDRNESTTMVREERKARIRQMMEPVSKMLKSSDLREVDPSSPGYQNAVSEVQATGQIHQQLCLAAEQPHQDKKNSPLCTDKLDETTNYCADDTTDGSVDDEEQDNEQLLVRVPVPGIVMQQHEQQHSTTALPTVTARVNDPLRWVPATCSICISSYEVKSLVVWSSNANCPHVFHAACMERWLFNQHDDPICPCCRREFLIDPYDILEEEMERGTMTIVVADDPNGSSEKAINFHDGPPDPPGNEQHLTSSHVQVEDLVLDLGATPSSYEYDRDNIYVGI